MKTSNSSTTSKFVRFILIGLSLVTLAGCVAAGPGYNVSVGGGRGYYNGNRGYNNGYRGHGHRHQQYCRQVPRYDYYGNYIDSYRDCR
ncbi:MAG: hypothetical protein QG625_426 [Cyanobacteriota bacterium erpe_2018_sw_39hr_WHONDRS-SW48-000098_B_bin.30]|jgi:hypothetical protein|nr:hypothetical protein [Cyanobacteriota bacterium erpe_2018_sw_39hr_WHONDRS-SW48-000098_B_bin.30]